DHLLPWAHHLGTPDPAHQRARTAIERTEHHLAAPDITSPTHQAARELLNRRDQLLEHFNDERRFEQRLDTIAARNRARARNKDRGHDYGLGL
ncbi:hypothetical protein, partial [Mycobacterium avium]